MSHVCASGLVTAAFLGLVFVLGQDAPAVSFAPPVETEEILVDEDLIDSGGCEDDGERSDLPSAIPEIERIEAVDPQPEAGNR